MRKNLKSFLIVLFGFIVGSIVNMAFTTIGPYIVPLPQGVDVSTIEGLNAGMHLMETKHFLFPFLAHALGTFAGAYFVARNCKRNKLKLALTIGVLFLFGGIYMVFTVSSPQWFAITDLVFAYIPMAYLAGKLGIEKYQLKLFNERF